MGRGSGGGVLRCRDGVVVDLSSRRADNSGAPAVVGQVFSA